jgi:hypothetical protein
MAVFDNNVFALGVVRPIPRSPLGIFNNYPSLLALTTFADGRVNMLLFQAPYANIGRSYVGSSHIDRTQSLTDGTIYELNPGDSISISGASSSVNILEALNYLIDVDSSGDGVRVTVHVR